MRRKEDAQISKKSEADYIYDYLGKYFVVPPFPPVVSPELY